MRTCVFLFFILFWLSACNNASVTDTSAPLDEVTVINVDTLCFQRLEGTVNKDISSVRLVISNNEVTGDVMYIPFEKDSRIGTIKGSRKGDIIKGMWTYMQEGIVDSLNVEFKLNGNILMQKNYSFDSATGRQFLSDTSRFVIEHQKIDCSSFPEPSF